MIANLRSFLFQAAYWTTSIVFAVLATPLLVLPNRKPVMIWTQTYTKVMCFWLRWIAGVRIIIRGREHLPEGPCIIAAKHQSWGDGIIMFSQIFDLAFVTGDHLEKLPLLGGILRKMGAIVVNNCGGPFARAALIDNELEKAKAEDRRILIYPEGHLSPVGQQHRYKKGVYHLYDAYGCPVVPVATNLGLRWPQQSWRITPGEAVVEFLEPIKPGVEKKNFMTRLESAIEQRSIALLGDEGPHNTELGAVLPDPQG